MSADDDRLDPDASDVSDEQRRLADALPILIMIADPNGEVQFFNRRWYEFTGQAAPDGRRPRGWDRYMHPADGLHVQEAWEAGVTRRERTIKMRYRLMHDATRDYRWVSAQAVAVTDEHGNIMQWVGAAVDVHDDVTTLQASLDMLTQQTAIAHIFQKAALPGSFPAIPGLAFDALYRGSDNELLLGGDWYDVVVLPDGEILFSMGDVLGHGMTAAIEMGRVRQSIVTAGANSAEPDELLRRVNRVMRMQGTVATAIVGAIDVARGRVVLSSAGHPRPLLVGADGHVREVVTDGIALGLIDTMSCAPVELRMTAGDTLVMYTDGLVEFDRNIDAAERRLLSAAASERHDIAGYAGRIRDAVMDASSSPDDVAILAIRFTAQPG